MNKLICIIFFLIASISFAQQKKDLRIFKPLFTPQPKQKIHFSENFGTNDLKNIFAGIFWGYKTFVSSQDASRCNFYPSCSVYSIQTIKKHGIVVGLFDTFDRLSRCNGYNHENYPVHEPDGKCYDPVE